MRRLRVAALSEVELAMDIINQAKAHLRAQGIDQWNGTSEREKGIFWRRTASL